MSHSDFYDGKAAAYRRALSLARQYEKRGSAIVKELQALLQEALANKAYEEEKEEGEE